MIDKIKTIWQEHQEAKELQSSILKKRNWQGHVEEALVDLMSCDPQTLTLLALKGRIEILNGNCRDIPKQFYFKPPGLVMALTRNVFRDTFMLVTATEANARLMMQEELYEYCKDCL